MKNKKLQVFYDGLCPLCTKEISHYRKIDINKKIEFIDISNPNFDEKTYGLEGREFNKTFHVKDKSGEFKTAVDGFVAIWDELNCFKPLSYMAKNKVSRPLFDIGYCVFANVRPLFRNNECPEEVCER